ncbi:hypothetical protein FACS189440_09750 [Bacteroidia bacterium]|nr:hypothetical protein FACS189423_00390 [Bacteroidia bacterium]GHT47856.1 hypothetical protein FACS189440_09750 [Bacteroidia bacterium]
MKNLKNNPFNSGIVWTSITFICLLFVSCSEESEYYNNYHLGPIYYLKLSSPFGEIIELRPNTWSGESFHICCHTYIDKSTKKWQQNIEVIKESEMQIFPAYRIIEMSPSTQDELTELTRLPKWWERITRQHLLQ